jgi:hypothetical protein
MKKLLTAQACLAAFFLAPMAYADWHEFTSADGSKKVWAEVQGFDASTQTVSLKLEGNRIITSPVTAFTEDDQKFVEKAAVALAAGRNLAIEFADDEEEISEKKNPTNGYRTVELKSGYALELRNNSKEPFKGLTAEYQLFYAAYLDPFKDRARTDQVSYGKMKLPEVKPRDEATIETEAIDITRITRLPLSQCSGGT